ncbi:hypothetical protein [Deinococcus apachensis]|uniref:hypothetical protein n=1 Tax=Deinococcus apachensis TaxID=309886 RepID=UPI00036EF2A8|nr:hypothetical protein [Deinococcus apachensis]
MRVHLLQFAALTSVLVGTATASSAPAALFQMWFAGSGGVSSPYDPTTGQLGSPNGSGLLYHFSPNGTYVKAFQSQNSNGGCTNGFMAVEQGTFEVDGAELVTHPAKGVLQVKDTCVPSLNSVKPLTDLQDETWAWNLGPSGLRLTRSDGMTALFQPAS